MAEAHPIRKGVFDEHALGLAREHIKKLPHPGVAFRPLAPPVKSDYCIAWNRNNDSRALQEYVEIVKSLTAPVR